MLEHGHNQTPNTLISSPVVSHAKIFPTLEKERDYKGSEADSFLKSAALLATWDQESLCWRTSQLCLLGGWMKFSGRWPRSGTMRNGIAYRLPPLVPRISGTEYSYWPTPTSLAKAKDGYNAAGNSCGLVAIMDKIKKGFLPTPRATDGKNGCRTAEGAEKELKRGKNIDLGTAVGGGKLNPQWIEWLIGFPHDWTDCVDSETQS